MKLSRTIALLLLLVSGFAHAQGWREAYDEALGHVSAARWTDARKAFQRAASLRPEDFAGQTMLPGSVTEPKPWRDGSPYSPNFGAAVMAYRAAIAAADDASRLESLRLAARELDLLLEKNQRSKEAIYFLTSAYALLGDVQAQQNLEAKVQSGKAPAWKVDAAIVTPEEYATIATLTFTRTVGAPPIEPAQPQPAAVAQPAAQPASPPTPRRNPTDPGPPTNPTNPPNPTDPPVAPVAGPYPAGMLAVAPMMDKYALVVGNTTSLLPEGEVPFAASDAGLIKDRLVQAAGYPAANVDVLLDASAAQIMAAARALAERMPEDGTVMLFFTGAGANLDGKDYLAGVDTQSATDSSTMVAKTDVYRLFMAKGARIFAFYQVSRPMVDGRYFGMEVPMVGAVAQMQATMPGERIFSITRSGQTNGLFAHAMGSVLSDFRSNRIPILEFGWQVFFSIRRGGTTGTGLGSVQTPTLPVITNMGADARF